MASVQLPRSAAFGPLQRIGFFFLIAFLFLVHARIADKVYYLHIPILTYWIAVAFSFLTGGVLRGLFSRIGFLMVGLSAWLALATLASLWKGRSVEVLREYWLMSFVMFVLIAGMTVTHQQCRYAMHTMAAAVLVLSLWTFLFGQSKDGRLYLPESRFNNPNELGQMMILGIAFWWYIISDRSLSPLRRILAGIAVLPLLVVAIRTGSRAALVAAVILAAQLFFRASFGGKVRIGLAALGVVALAAVLLPGPIQQRFFVIFSPEPDAEEEFGTPDANSQVALAASSGQARWRLLEDSLRITFDHPLLGVGPGMFPDAQDELAKARGEPHGSWQVTHNTYTEFSSEAGLPALALYAAALFFSFRLLGSLQRVGRLGGPAGFDIANAAFSLRLALTSYAVSGLFGSFAYHMYFPVLAGLAVAWNVPAHQNWSALRSSQMRLRKTPARQPIAQPQNYR
jgi:hypothetical protein